VEPPPPPFPPEEMQRAGQKTLIQETLNNGLGLSGEYRTISNQLLQVQYSYHECLNRVPFTVLVLTFLTYYTIPDHLWQCSVNN
jgi:hypothetical protein